MKLKYIISSLLLAAFAISSCSDDEVAIVPPVQYIQLNETQPTLGISETLKLTAKVTPENAADTTVIWENLNEAIATIDDQGIVTGIAEGIDTIYAVRNNVKAICIVKVVPVPVSEVKLDIAEKVSAPNSTIQLTATILPAHATDKTLTWTSSDESVATVSETGLVTLGANFGSAVITVTSSNGKTAICEVVALGDEPIILPSVVKLEKNMTRDVRVLLPEKLKNEVITWKSLNEEIATVTPSAENAKNATIKVLAMGKTKVVAVVAGVEYACEVECEPNALEINGVSALVNLDKYENKAAVAQLIKDLDAKAVTEYVFYGDFQKLTLGDQENMFAGTNVVKIDFTGIDAKTWSEVTCTKGGTPVAGVGLPEKAFNCVKGKNPYAKLETVILPEAVKAIGFNAFQYLTSLKTLEAPGAIYLGDVMFNDIKLTTLKLTTAEEFVFSDNTKTGFLGGFKARQAPCTLYIHSSKEIPADLKYFGKPFAEIKHE